MYIYIYPYTNVKKHFVEKKQHTQLWKKISIFQSIPSFCFNPRPALWFFQSPFNHPLLASPKTMGKKDKTKIILVYLCYYTLKGDVTKKKRTRTITPKPCQKKKTTLFFGGGILWETGFGTFSCTTWMASARGDGDGTSCHISHPGLVRGSVSSREGNIHCCLDSLCWFTQILAMMKSCQKKLRILLQDL